MLPTLGSSPAAGRLFGFALLALAQAEDPTGSLRFQVAEPGTDGRALPCRIHVFDADGEPVFAPGVPSYWDHFSCEGAIEWDVPVGRYTYLVARGPEYREARGEVTVRPAREARVRVELERWIDMAERGWWSGETHIHRELEEMNLLMRSEDLHVASVVTQWNKKNRWRDRAVPRELVRDAGDDRLYHVLGGEDERGGGALAYVNLSQPLRLFQDRWEYPPSLAHLPEALAQRNVFIEIEKPFWWDVPAWMATGEVDWIGLANNHMCRVWVYEREAWGRPRDESRLPPPRGNGFYSQEIYYRLLNCGFRLPPSAGSGSGALPNPIGYNRVYVHLDGELTWDAWLKGLAAGRSFVTNGPMLLVEANGQLPGAVLKEEDRGAVEVVLDVRVSGNDPLEAIDIVRDGRIVQRITGDDLADWVRPQKLIFEESGWFLVRAITGVSETLRFASTAPFYVEVGGADRRVHRRDVKFFLNWIDERIENLQKEPPEDAGPGVRKHLESDATLGEVLAPQHRARRFFEELLKEAR